MLIRAPEITARALTVLARKRGIDRSTLVRTILAPEIRAAFESGEITEEEVFTID